MTQRATCGSQLHKHVGFQSQSNTPNIFTILFLLLYVWVPPRLWFMARPQPRILGISFHSYLEYRRNDELSTRCFWWLSRFFCVVRRYLFGNVLLDFCFPSAVGLPKYSQRSGIHRYPILLRSYLHLQFGCGEYNYMTTSTGGSLPEISWATLLMLTSESCLHPGSTMFDHHVVGKLLVAPWLPMNCRKVE